MPHEPDQFWTPLDTRLLLDCYSQHYCNITIVLVVLHMSEFCHLLVRVHRDEFVRSHRQIDSFETRVQSSDNTINRILHVDAHLLGKMWEFSCAARNACPPPGQPSPGNRSDSTPSPTLNIVITLASSTCIETSTGRILWMGW